jgi:hypothetical protein
LIETVQSNGVLKNINLYVDQKPWKRIETYWGKTETSDIC